MSKPPETIACLDCGGLAHMISYLPVDEEPDPEAAVSYRCADCMERFDIVFGDDGLSGPIDGP